MPTLRQLEYLVAIADTLHFRRASEKAGVSQPTLSAQLLALEQRLGVQLVERSRSRVLLTDVGSDVERLARRILRDVQEIRDMAASRTGALAGTIRLGLPPTIGPYLLPHLLPGMHRAYPDLKLYVREEMPHGLPHKLEEGGHDVIIMPVPVAAADLESLPVFREPLYITVPSDGDLAARGVVDRKDLRGRSILTLESGHHLREQVEAICEEFGADLRPNFEGTSLDTLRHMVGMGMGLTFLPGLFVHSALAGDETVKAMELKGRSIYRTIGVVWRKTSARREEFERLAAHIRETVRDNFPQFQVL